jgi:AraC-like DNA-binding protein
VTHLRPWFGDAVAVGTEPVLEIDLPNDVLDRPLADHRAPLEGEPPCDWAPLKGDLSVAHSVKLLMVAMEADPPVTLDRLARSGGLSTRTLQRLLATEGTCLRDLLDDMHRDRSLAMLPDTSSGLGTLASTLGYSAQSSLSRAVRRWTGLPPKVVRSSTRHRDAGE